MLEGCFVGVLDQVATHVAGACSLRVEHADPGLAGEVELGEVDIPDLRVEPRTEQESQRDGIEDDAEVCILDRDRFQGVEGVGDSFFGPRRFEEAITYAFYALE